MQIVSITKIETTLEVDGEDRQADDFQPRKQARDQLSSGIPVQRRKC